MKMRELLATPEKWTKGELARNKDGVGVESESPEACRWCIGGADDVCNGAGGMSHSLAWAALRERLKMAPADWNDAPERTHAEVLAVLKELDL